MNQIFLHWNLYLMLVIIEPIMNELNIILDVLHNHDKLISFRPWIFLQSCSFLCYIIHNMYWYQEKEIIYLFGSFSTLVVCFFSGDGYWEYLKGLRTSVVWDGSLSCVCCWLGSCATSVFGKEYDPLGRYVSTLIYIMIYTVMYIIP